MGSLHVKFHDDRCKGKAVMRRKPFSVIYAVTLTFDLKIYRAHPCLMGSLHVKFHDDRCKGKAVMRRKPFSVIYALWPWPLDLKIYRAHPWLMGSLHVKFHDDRCKGKAVMRRKPKCGRQTDGRTDRRTWWFQYTPPPIIRLILWFRSCWNIVSKLNLAPVNFHNRKCLAMKLILYTYKFK